MRSGSKRRFPWGLLLCGLPAVARADIYTFVDSSGVAHFSNVPTDGRYQLLLTSPPQEPGDRTAHWLAKSQEFDRFIERAAQQAAVRPELLRAVIVVESAFNPRAISARGAVGLMQLRPATARRYGVSNAFDPEQNIRAGARYLRDLMLRYGNNLELTLAAYNAGEDAVEHYGRSVPPFAETRHYVPTVIRVYHALLSHPRSS